MIYPRDIEKIVIDDRDMVALIKSKARELELGGVSGIYGNEVDRLGYLEENQLTGQIGECAACLALYDYDKYEEKASEKISRGAGDGGRDIPGSTVPIDVKGSNVKCPYERLNTFMYARRLMVAKREFSPNAIYVGVAIEEMPTHDDEFFTAYVMGWTYGSKLNWENWVERKTEREREGFRKPYGHLSPLKSMDWGSLLEEHQVA